MSHDVFRNSWDTVVTIPVNISTPNLLYYGLQSGETFDAADSGIGLQSATVRQGRLIYNAANDCPAALGHTHNGTRVRAYFTTTSSGLDDRRRTLRAGSRRRSTRPRPCDGSPSVPRNSTTDIVYGAAPTEIDANTGRLYLFEVP